jgi:glutathione S-transferase
MRLLAIKALKEQRVMASDATLKLISFDLCPFVQRSIITLQEKGVPYEIEYIDLTAKPSWFLKLSPTGKVPLLLVGDHVLFESAAINEYLDETTGETRLHPKDPLVRAQHRAWIAFASDLNFSVHKVMVSAEELDARAAADVIRPRLQRLEQEVAGPLFSGEALCLVDAATAPALQRLHWCQQRKPQLELFAELPKVEKWKDALLRRPSVVRSTVEDIEARFDRYIRGYRGEKKPSEPVSWLAE